jgi:hypothetical protein
MFDSTEPDDPGRAELFEKGFEPEPYFLAGDGVLFSIDPRSWR